MNLTFSRLVSLNSLFMWHVFVRVVAQSSGSKESPSEDQSQ